MASASSYPIILTTKCRHAFNQSHRLAPVDILGSTIRKNCGGLEEHEGGQTGANLPGLIASRSESQKERLRGNMTGRSNELVLITINATWAGGTEAEIYGTPLGLRSLAASFRRSIADRTSSTLYATAPTGPLVETGVNLLLHLTDDHLSAATLSFSNTLRFRKLKRRYFDESSVEYTTRRPTKCAPRNDGGFAVAYPLLGIEYSLVIAGNSTGILHIADHLESMADVDYGPYNPDWPEASEHYHSWIDRENDVMLECGLGLVYGRLDHRKDRSTDWMLADRPCNREELKLLVDGEN